MGSAGDQELAGLDRVLTRLGMTDESNLEKVLSKLLPIVIGELKSTNVQARKKVLEILSHVNKRVKSRNDIVLPLTELIDLYRSSDLPMVRNFALVYVDMAFQRTDSKSRLTVVSKLLESLEKGSATEEQRGMVLRMAVAGLESLASPSHGSPHGQEADFAAQFPFLGVPVLRKMFLNFALKVVLYVPPASLAALRPRNSTRSNYRAGSGGNPIRLIGPNLQALSGLLGRFEAEGRANSLRSLQGAVSQVPTDTANPASDAPAEPEGPPVPPGLSPRDVAQVEGKEPANSACAESVMSARKLAILNFTAAAGIPAGEVVLHYLAAACSPFDAVAKRGEELARKRCGVDSMKPEVDLEDQALVGHLLRVFLGTTWDSKPLEERVQPVNPSLQARLLGLFCRSIAAANSFPQTLQVIQASVLGGESPLRLKQAGMQFAVWVFKHAQKEHLKGSADDILYQLLDVLDAGTSGADPMSLQLRAFTYQAVGQLAERVPEVVQGNSTIASRFFSALAVESASVRGSVQEALPSLALAYRGCSQEVEKELEELLLASLVGEADAVRLAAVQWAVRFFPFSSPVGRYVSMIAAGDLKLEVREAGLSGLKPPTRSGVEAEDEDALPSTSALVIYVLSRHPVLQQPLEPNEKLQLPAKSFLALISFLRQCWQEDREAAALLASSSGDLEQLPDIPDQISEGYLSMLEHALVREASSDLHVAALESMLEVAGESPAMFSKHYALRISLFTPFLGHVDASARDIAGKLVGLVGSGLPLPAAEALLRDHSGVAAAVETEGTKKGSRLEERLGSIAVTGYLMAQLPEASPELLGLAASRLCTALQDNSPLVAGTAATALGHAGLQRVLPLPLGDPPCSGSHSPAGTSSSERSTAGDTDGPSKGTVATRAGVLASLTSLMSSKDLKVAAKAVIAAGQLAAGDEALLPSLLPALWELAPTKGEELHFAVGEALSWSFGGVPVPPSVVLHTNFRSLTSTLLSTEGSGLEDRTAPAGETEGTAGADSVSPARRAAQEEILGKLLGELVLYSSKDEVRAAGCVWLVSLLMFTRGSTAVAGRLTEVQSALTQLLGHSSELAQEMASRGLSVVYRLADSEGRKDLLENLMATLQGNRKRRAIKVEGSTRVFEEGAVELPSGGSLTTYKELCELATDLGQPDLLYKFMDLANHAASLQSSRGAAFGFASIAKLAGEQLTPYVSLLIPKLYRYQYDPKPQVRDAMIHIWRTLVPEPKQAIDANFKEILSLLLQEMGGHLWRIRESASLALADLLQGRRWAEVEERYEEIWTMSFRVADDVKETTRAAGTAAVRTLRGLTLRVCDPAATSSTSDALSTVLPFLLRRVMGTSVAEERVVALTIIAQLAKSATREQLQSHLGDLVPIMLESLSGMEDERLNYLEQHTERLGIDTGRLENLRVSASRSSPMADTLDICARVADAASLEALVPKLAALAKRGVGLNTRSGTARFIGLLTQRLGTELRPSCGTLISALMSAAGTERSPAVRKAFSTALGQVAKVSSEPKVAKLVSDALALHSSPGDRDARLLSGTILKDLLRQAPEKFQAQAGSVLPIAFIARSDEEAEVATVWSDVWEEGGSSLRLYVPDIVVLVLQDLQSQQWGRKAAAAKAMVSLSKGAADAMKPHSARLVSALLQELPGRLWSGKEAVLDALAAVSRAAPADVPADAIVPALIAAAGRKNASFRKSALAALETTIDALPGDHLRVAGPVLLEGISAHAAAPPSRASTPAKDEQEGEEGGKLLPLVECIKCLGVAWKGASLGTISELAEPISKALPVPLSPEQPWAVRAAALANMKAFVERLVSLGELSETSRSEMSGQQSVEPAFISRLVTPLIPGILAGFDELRVSQVRGAALDALSAVLTATSEGATLPPDTLGVIAVKLSQLIAAEKLPSIKAQAAIIKQRLPEGRDDTVTMALG